MPMNMCPICNRGHLRPTRSPGIVIEDDIPFRKPRHNKEYVCDICGYRYVNTDINPDVK